MTYRMASFPMTFCDLQGHSRITSLCKGSFTARRYASAVYAVVVCPSVLPSVCLSQAGTVPNG